jgi:hypothetical protein
MPLGAKKARHDYTSCYQTLSDDRRDHRLFWMSAFAQQQLPAKGNLLTERPNDKRAEPPVHPEILTPVVIQNPTYDHAPHVLRLGGRGTVSRFNYQISTMASRGRWRRE